MELNSKNIKKILFIIFLGALILTAFQNFGLVILGVKKIFNIFIEDSAEVL